MRAGRSARMPASVASRGRAAAACRIVGRQIISTVPAAASRGASAVCPSSRPASAMTSAGAAANAAARAGQAAAICHSASGPAGAGSTNWRQGRADSGTDSAHRPAAARPASCRASSAYRTSPALPAQAGGCPRHSPASTAPPAGSHSASTAVRGQAMARARPVVVTPGDPPGLTRTIRLIGHLLLP